MWNQATFYVNNQYIDHEQDRDIERSYKDANQRRGSSNTIASIIIPGHVSGYKYIYTWNLRIL